MTQPTVGEAVISIGADTSELTGDLRQAGHQMERTLSNSADAAMRSMNQSFAVGVQRMERRLESLDRRITPEVQPDVDMGHASAQLALLSHSRVVTIQANLQAAAAQAQLAAMQRQNVQIAISRASAALYRTQMAAMTRDRRVNITANLKGASDKTLKGLGTALSALSGFRLTRKLIDPSILKNLDVMVPKIAGVASAVGGLSAALLAASSNAISLAGGLVQMLPAALVLPGVFTSLGTSLAVTFIALKDINNQMSGLEEAGEKMAKTINDAFWKVAEGPIRSLLNNVLPKINDGLGKVADATGVLFANLADDFNRIVANRLPAWFAATARATDNFAAASPAIATITRVLGDLGATYVPRLATAVANMLTGWADWLTKAEETGELNRMVEQAIQNIKDLGRILGASFGILRGIFKAAQAAGASTLDTFADSLEHISDAINSVQGQAALTELFNAAHSAMNQIATKSGPGVTAFFTALHRLMVDILPIIGSVIGNLLNFIGAGLAVPELSAGIVSFFEALDDAAAQLGPTFEVVGRSLGGLAHLLGVFVTSVLPLVTTAIERLDGTVTGLLPTLEGVVQSLSKGLLDVLNALLPAVEVLAPALNTLLEGLGSSIGKILSDAAPGLETFFMGIATWAVSVVAALDPLITLLGNELGPAIGTLGTMLGAMLTASAPFAKMMLDIAAAIIGPLISGLNQFIQQVAPTVIAAWGRITSGFAEGQPIIDAIIYGFKVLMQVIASTAFKALAELMLLPIQLFIALYDGVKNVGDAFRNFDVGSITGIIGHLNELWEVAKALASVLGIDVAASLVATTDPMKWFNDAMIQLGTTIWNFVTTMIGPLVENIKTLARVLGFDLNAALVGLTNPFTQAGTDTSGLQSKFTELGTSANTTAPQITGLGTEATNAGPPIQNLGTYASGSIPGLLGLGSAAGSAAGNVAESFKRMSTETDGRLRQLSTQAGVLTGKAKRGVIKEMVGLRAGSLKQLAGLTTGSDKKFVQMAQTANTKLGKLATSVGKLTGKAKTAGMKKLEEMRTEYERKFGNINNSVNVLDKLPGEIGAAMAGVPEAISGPIGEGGDAAGDEAKEIPTDVARKLKAMDDMIATSLTAVPEAISDPIEEGRSDAVSVATGTPAAIANKLKATDNLIASAMAGSSTAISKPIANGKTNAAAAASLIPGAIAGKLGGIPGSMQDKGYAAIAAYARGMRNAIPLVKSAAAAVAAAASSNMQMSPAKEGPFSGRGYSLYRGQNTVQMFAKGMEKALPKAERAATTVANSLVGSMVPLTSASRISPVSTSAAAATTNSSAYNFNGMTIMASTEAESRVIEDFVALARRKARASGAGTSTAPSAIRV